MVVPMRIIGNYVLCTLPSNSRAHQANVSVYSESFRQFVVVDPIASHAYDFESVKQMDSTDKQVLRRTRRDEERVRSEIEEHIALQTADNIRAGKKGLPWLNRNLMRANGI